MRLCPDCQNAPAPDQRPQAKDGRCARCKKRLGIKEPTFDDGFMLPAWLAG